MNHGPTGRTQVSPRPSLFRCEFCEAQVRDTMAFCPKCNLRLDVGQRELVRANVLLGEAGSWYRTAEVPRDIADRLLYKYQGEHHRAMASLIARSPHFRPGAVPLAEAAVVAPAAPVVLKKEPIVPLVKAAPLAPPVVVEPGWVVQETVAPPPPAPAAPPPVAALVVPPPVVAGAPAISSSNPEAIPAAAPVEVVSLDAQGKPRFSAPRIAPRKPEVPKEDLLFGVLSERHLNWLASAGVFAVFVAIVLLVRNQWENYAPRTRVGLIALAAGAAMGLGALLRSKTVLKMTGTSLFVLGALSTPVVFAAAAWYHATSLPPSAVGFAGAVASAALYAWLGGRPGFAYFRWLAVASAMLGHGFLLDMCGVTGGDLAPGYGLLGVALAGLAVWKRRPEFEVAAAAVLVGSLIVSVPFVLNGDLHQTAIDLLGAMAMSAGFAILSKHDSRWMHGAWVAAGGAALAGCNAAHAEWAKWPASLAAVGAAAYFITLKKHARTEPLFAGGGVLLAIAGVLAVTGYAHAVERQADLGLLFFTIFAIPAVATMAWKRDNEFLAQATLVLPGATFFAIKHLFHLPTGYLPIVLGAYAAALYAFGLQKNIFARASTQVAVLVHATAFLLCCNPGIEELRAIPFFWHDFAGRAALALALPGISLLAFRVRREPVGLYAAEPSLLASLIFAAHAAGLAGSWMPALAAGAALAAVAAAWRFGDAFRIPTRNMGAIAAIPAAVVGFVFWARPEGAVSLALSGAVFTSGGLAVAVDYALFVGVGLLGAAWASAIDRHFDAPLQNALGALAFLPAAAASVALRDMKRRLEALAGAAVVSVAMLCILLADPASRVAPGAMLAALSLGLLAVAAGALGFRTEETPGIAKGEPAGWSAAGALLAMLSGGFVMLALGVSDKWLPAACALVPAALVIAGSMRQRHPQGPSWAVLGAAGLGMAVVGAVPGSFASIAAASAIAAIPAMFVAFSGPQRPFASGAAAALLSLSAGCVAYAQQIPSPWLAPACALVPALFVIAGSFRMKQEQGAPWVSLGAGCVVIAIALSLDSGYASVAAATAVASIPAMLLAFSGPMKEVASGAGAALLSISAACLAHAMKIPAPWLASSCGLVPAAFALAGRARLGQPQSRSWLGAGALGLVAAIVIGAASGSSLEFAFAVALASVPAFVLSCYGPEREGSATAFGILACIAAAAFAHNLTIAPEWIPVVCAAVPAILVVLGAYAHFLPQGRPWASVGGVALAVALGFSLYYGPLSFGVTALICAGAAGSAVRFSPATLSGVAAFCFNASVVSFMIHAGLHAEVAAPLLATLAALEALAASMAGARTSAHAVFTAAAALVFGAVIWAFAGPTGAEPNLIPGMIALGIAGGTAALLAFVRRQPYLWAITGCCAAAEFYLALAHIHVTTLEAYTFPPAILLLVWAHFAARRKATVVEQGPRGPFVEAFLSDWSRRLAATVHEELGNVRLLAIVASVGPTLLLALPPSERLHLPYALVGSAAVLVSGVLARRKKEAIAGIAALGSLVAIKAVQWMLERELSAAWWILVVGGSLLTFVAVFEIRRSWYLKGKGEAVRKVVEAYLAKWR